MLRDFAYSLILGKPLVLWLGLAAMICFLSAASIIALNNYTKVRIPIEWHKRFAIAGLIIAIVHMVLAISAYI
jgi:hypothetical protein